MIKFFLGLVREINNEDPTKDPYYELKGIVSDFSAHRIRTSSNMSFRRDCPIDFRIFRDFRYSVIFVTLTWSSVVLALLVDEHATFSFATSWWDCPSNRCMLCCSL